jgi:Rha family phage regulatory protein
MADNSISILASVDNPITHNINGQPAVSSRDVALRFQKKHKEILRDIERIRSLVPQHFYERNFAPIEIDVLLPHSGGIRKDPAYLLTRDAFSLLAMGFTGKAAIQWKLRYIEAFNALEEAALNSLRRQAEAVRQSALAEGRMTALALYRRVTPQRRALIRRALRYKGMGLGSRDTGKLMDCSRQLVCSLLKDAAMLGMEARRDTVGV